MLLGIQLPEMDEIDADFLVDADNWDAVELFVRCSTQWQIGPMGGMLGLRYEGVKVVLDVAFPRKRHSEILASIQIMEQAAMAAINSKSK